MVKHWGFHQKDKQQYVELSNLDYKTANIEERYAERPWYRNFSLETWRPVVWAGITLLLGASNAATQILAAPSRAEVDHAHSKGKWMHIGVYNSAIFNTTAVFDYNIFMVTPAFVKGGNFSIADAAADMRMSSLPFPYGDVYFEEPGSDLTGIENNVSALQQQAMGGNLTFLTWQDCITQFSTDLQSKFSAVLLVMKDNPSTTNSFWSSFPYYPPGSLQGEGPSLKAYAWVCNGAEICVPQQIRDSGTWNLSRISEGFNSDYEGQSETIDHCLARSVQQACSVDVSINLMVAVIVCNIIKLCCFLHCLSIKEHKPFITVGDAICSFLAKSDPHSVGLGPVSSREVRRGSFQVHRDAVSMARTQLPHQPLVFPGKPWEGRRHKYYSAVSLGRWISTGVLSGIIFFAGLLLLIGGKHLVLGIESLEDTGTDQSGAGVSQTNYGTAAFNTNLGFNPSGLLPGNFGLFSAIFSANVIQLAVSNAYLFINNIFTCALVSQELSDYATESKMMRVTRPRGPQRSTYWLQLPYKWSLPLMAMMTLLHWLISEALFMVDVQVFDPDGRKIPPNSDSSDGSFYGLAWGPTATLCAVVEGGLIISFVYAYGFRKFTAGVPVFSSCSIAISAGCHMSTQEYDDAIFRPLKYGVLKTGKLGDAQPVGFSALEVTPLQKGELYGGTPYDDDDDARDVTAATPPTIAKPDASLTAESSEQARGEHTEEAALLSSGEQPAQARSRMGWRRLPSFQ
ncbi:MAG: hypothetical protein Q9162_001780 [Coniocarpon cinnabarinum]